MYTYLDCGISINHPKMDLKLSGRSKTRGLKLDYDGAKKLPWFFDISLTRNIVAEP